MRIACKNGKAYLPDFLIVGAAKSGTTSLHFYLNQHPRIFFPVYKEPRYFSQSAVGKMRNRQPVTDSAIEGVVTGFEEYVTLFESAKPVDVLGESSTEYLYCHSDVIPAIQEAYGAAAKGLHIFIVLRNPVERAWSNYLMHRNAGVEPLDFCDAIREDTVAKRLSSGWPVGYDYIGFGLYARQVRAWLEQFPSVSIFLSEDLASHPTSVLRKVCETVGVDPTIDFDTGRSYNKGGAAKGFVGRALEQIIFRPNKLKSTFRKLVPPAARFKLRTAIGQTIYAKEPIPAIERQYLENVYRQDVRALEGLLGVSLQRWLEADSVADERRALR